MIIGSQPYANLFEFIFTILPDIFLFFLLAYSIVLIYKDKVYKMQIYDWVILIFILSNMIIGSIVSGDIAISIRGFRITYFPILFYFTGRFLWSNNQEQFLKTINFIFLSFVCLAIIGLIIYFIIPSFEVKMIGLTGHKMSTYFIKRMTSILWTPVLFGTLMSFTSVYFFYKILIENKPIHYLFFSIVYCCLLLSVSRGPVLASMVGYLILFIFNRKWYRFLFTTIIILFFSTLISFYATGSFKFVTWIFRSTSQTLSMENGVTRVERWKASDIKLNLKPYGFGLGKAGATAFRFLNNDSSNENNTEQNTIIDSMYDTVHNSSYNTIKSLIDIKVHQNGKIIDNEKIKDSAFYKVHISHTNLQEGIDRVMTSLDSEWLAWRTKYLYGSIDEMRLVVFNEVINDVVHGTAGDSYLTYNYPNIESFVKIKKVIKIKNIDSNTTAAPYSTDGWYLKLANETGLIGLSTYFLLIGIYFIFALKKLFKENKNISVLVFAVFIMVNIQNVVCNTLDFYPFIILYWLLIGISANYFFKPSINKK